jgi:hypothetical protein
MRLKKVLIVNDRDLWGPRSGIISKSNEDGETKMKMLSAVICCLLLQGQEFLQERNPKQRPYLERVERNALKALDPLAIGTGSDQSLLLDEFGDLTATWYGPNSTYLISRSQNHGASWSAPVTLPFSATIPGSLGTNPTVAVEANGAIDIISQCEESGSVTCPGNAIDIALLLTRSVDGGKTWSAPVNVSLPPISEGAGADEASLLPCGGGVVLVWQDDGNSGVDEHSNPNIILRYIVGGIPETVINLSNTPMASDGHPQMVVNAQSNVFVTWVSDNGQGGNIATDSIMFAAVPNCGRTK